MREAQAVREKKCSPSILFTGRGLQVLIGLAEVGRCQMTDCRGEAVSSEDSTYLLVLALVEALLPLLLTLTSVLLDLLRR